MKNLTDTKFVIRMPLSSTYDDNYEVTSHLFAFDGGLELTLDYVSEEMSARLNGEPAFVNDFDFSKFTFMTCKGGKNWRGLQADFAHCIQ